MKPGNNNPVCQGQCQSELPLEDVAPAGVTPRFENRPNSPAGEGVLNRFDGFHDRGRVMRKVVYD
jgi:hypothetical protein